MLQLNWNLSTGLLIWRFLFEAPLTYSPLENIDLYTKLRLSKMKQGE